MHHHESRMFVLKKRLMRRRIAGIERRRDKIWSRRWPFLELLMRGGLFMGPMLRAHHAANQASLDKVAKIQPLNHDYAFLLQQIFLDNEHLLRLIVSFL